MMLSFFTGLKRSDLIKFIKYGIVGVIGLMVDMGVFYILNKRLGINYAFANIISSSLAVINNFVLNSYFTFKVTDSMFRRFLSFYTVALIGMGVSTGMLALLIDVLKIDVMLSKLVAIFFVAIVQFFINSKFTFRTN